MHIETENPCLWVCSWLKSLMVVWEFTVDEFVFSSASDWTKNSPQIQFFLFVPISLSFLLISVRLWGRLIKPGKAFGHKMRHFTPPQNHHDITPPLKFALCSVWTLTQRKTVPQMLNYSFKVELHDKMFLHNFLFTCLISWITLWIQHCYAEQHSMKL